MQDVNDRPISPSSVDRGLTVSTVAGSIGMVFFTITGGAYLTGFARKLGASQFDIGIINALLPMAALAQLVSSYMVERRGWRRKPVLCVSASVMRLLWVPILLLPFLFKYTEAGAPNPEAQKAAVVIALAVMGLSQLLGSFGSLAWQAWMADLIPPDRRGRFYGTRTTIVNAVNIATGILVGKYLDINGTFQGFAVVFAAGVLFGVTDLVVHAFVPEPKPHLSPPDVPFLSNFVLPFKDPHFSGFIYFTVAWNFAMWVMLPFISVFQIETLKMSYLSITNMANLFVLSLMVSSVFVGKMTDRFGGRLVFIWSSAGISLLPLFWIFVDRGNWLASLIAMNILSGAFNSGSQVATSKLLLENSPKDKRSIYIAVFSSIGGLFGGLGPFLGGAIGDLFQSKSLSFFGYPIEGLKIVFMVSLILRISSLPLLLRLSEGRRAPAPVVRVPDPNVNC